MNTHVGDHSKVKKVHPLRAL